MKKNKLETVLSRPDQRAYCEEVILATRTVRVKLWPVCAGSLDFSERYRNLQTTAFELLKRDKSTNVERLPPDAKERWSITSLAHRWLRARAGRRAVARRFGHYKETEQRTIAYAVEVFVEVPFERIAPKTCTDTWKRTHTRIFPIPNLKIYSISSHVLLGVANGKNERAESNKWITHCALVNVLVQE